MTDRTQEGSSAEPGITSAALTISNGLVQLVSKYAGRGPTKARATVSSNHVVCVFEDVFTRSEQYLVADGRQDAVRHSRKDVWAMMRPEALRVVEDAVGRSVTASVADIDTTANVLIQVFLLAPDLAGDLDATHPP